MTTITPTLPAAAHTSVAPIRPLRFSTLTSVELRKLTDTRSSRWLLLSILGLVSGVLVYKLTQSRIEVAFDNYSSGVTTVVAFLAPIIALLAMTSEWTERTALTTFTLAPRRLPVIAAKYVAAVATTTVVVAEVEADVVVRVAVEAFIGCSCRVSRRALAPDLLPSPRTTTPGSTHGPPFLRGGGGPWVVRRALATSPLVAGCAGRPACWARRPRS